MSVFLCRSFFCYFRTLIFIAVATIAGVCGSVSAYAAVSGAIGDEIFENGYEDVVVGELYLIEDASFPHTMIITDQSGAVVEVMAEKDAVGGYDMLDVISIHNAGDQIDISMDEVGRATVVLDISTLERFEFSYSDDGTTAFITHRTFDGEELGSWSYDIPEADQLLMKQITAEVVSRRGSLTRAQELQIVKTVIGVVVCSIGGALVPVVGLAACTPVVTDLALFVLKEAGVIPSGLTTVTTTLNILKDCIPTATAVFTCPTTVITEFAFYLGERDLDDAVLKTLGWTACDQSESEGLIYYSCYILLNGKQFVFQNEVRDQSTNDLRQIDRTYSHYLPNGGLCTSSTSVQFNNPMGDLGLHNSDSRSVDCWNNTNYSGPTRFIFTTVSQSIISGSQSQETWGRDENINLQWYKTRSCTYQEGGVWSSSLSQIIGIEPEVNTEWGESCLHSIRSPSPRLKRALPVNVVENMQLRFIN